MERVPMQDILTTLGFYRSSEQEWQLDDDDTGTTYIYDAEADLIITYNNGEEVETIFLSEFIHRYYDRTPTIDEQKDESIVRLTTRIMKNRTK